MSRFENGRQGSRQILPSSNEHGFGMLQAVVSIALVLIAMGLLLSLINLNSNQAKRMFQKSEIQDVVRNVQYAFQDSAVCACQLGAVKFDIADTLIKEGASVVFPLGLSASCTPGASSSIVAPGAELPGTATGLIVESVKLVNIKQMGSLGTQYAGDLQITFDQKSTVGPYAPTSNRFLFNVNSAVPAASFVSACGVSGGGGSTLTMSSICTAFGGSWNGTTCSLSNNSGGSSGGLTLASVCQSLGGSWFMQSCTLPSSSSTVVMQAATPNYANWSVNMTNNLPNGRGTWLAALSGASPGSTVTVTGTSTTINGAPSSPGGTSVVGTVAANGEISWAGTIPCPAGSTCNYNWTVEVAGYGTRSLSTMISP